MILLDEAGR